MFQVVPVLVRACILRQIAQRSRITHRLMGGNIWLSQKANASNNDLKVQRKSGESVKITLLSHNESVSITSLEEARHLAKRRGMHLVQIQDMDSKSHRPVYKLVTAAEVLSNELSELGEDEKSSGAEKSEKVHKKSEKTLNIGSRITDHDLSSRLKHIAKWLMKQNEVRVLVQGNADDVANCERIVKAIEESIRTPEVIGKIVQKRTKGCAIKFSIIPVTTSAPKTVTQA